MKKGGESFFLLSHLLRALSHKIRTPLSVIANDLYYIGSQTSIADIARSQEKINEIAEILTHAVSPVSMQSKIDRCSIQDAIGELSKNFPDSIRSLIICVDAPGLKNAFQLLISLIELIFVTGERQGDFVILDFRGVMKGEKAEGDFSLFTQLFNEILQHQSVTPPLIDALFCASEVEVRGSVAGEEVRLQLQFHA